MTHVSDLLALAQADDCYALDAYAFVGEGLQTALSDACACVRLSAADLVDSCLALAAERFGMLAGMVLRSWGLVSSMDIGRVTFSLAATGMVECQDDDHLDDLDSDIDFEQRIRELLAA